MGSVREFVKDILSNIDNKSIVCDIGAGAGLIKEISMISNKANSLLGIDPNINVTKNKYLSSYFLSTIEEYDGPDESFDLIYSTFLIEHISQPQIFFDKCYRLLKPGGRMMHLTVNKYHYFAAISIIFEYLNLKEIYFKKIMRSKFNNNGFKTFYRANNKQVTKKMLYRSGFTDQKIFYSTDAGLIRDYFPYFKFIPDLIEKTLFHSVVTQNVLRIEAIK